MPDLLTKKMESDPNVMELLGAFLTGVVGRYFIYLLVNTYKKKKIRKEIKLKKP